MSIGCREPEEEGLVLGALLDVVDPVLLLARPTAPGDPVEGPVLVAEHMVLAGEHGVVSRLPQKLGEADLAFR